MGEGARRSERGQRSAVVSQRHTIQALLDERDRLIVDNEAREAKLAVYRNAFARIIQVSGNRRGAIVAEVARALTLAADVREFSKLHGALLKQ